MDIDVLINGIKCRIVKHSIPCSWFLNADTGFFVEENIAEISIKINC
jgi:hypothetical protein